MGKDKSKKSNGLVTAARTDDARFDKVYNDPRFMVAPNKVKKVEID